MFLGQSVDILRVFRRAKNDPIRGAAPATIKEMPPSYAAESPYNNVTATESGLLWEMDDTPGAERIHICHRTGTHIELRPDGSAKYVSKGARQDVTVADHEIIVNGDYKITVAGGANIYVRNGAFEIQADKGLAINVKGELKLRGDNIFMRADRKISLAAPQVDIGGVGKNASTPFLSLPTGVVPIFGVLVPRVTGIFAAASAIAAAVGNITDPAAQAAAFSQDNGKSLTLAKALKDSKGQPLVPEVQAPEEIPLSNPRVYNGKSVERIQFRERQFDTPEDVESGDSYTAHQNISEELGDFPSSVKELPGKQRTSRMDTEVPTNEPPPWTAYPLNASGGTVTFQSGNTIVVGVNTNFTEDIAVGMYLTFEGAPFQNDQTFAQLPRVTSVVNNTHLLIATPYPFATISNVRPYTFKYRPFKEYFGRRNFSLDEPLGNSGLVLSDLMKNYLLPVIEPEELTIPTNPVAPPSQPPNPGETSGGGIPQPVLPGDNPNLI
jgi:hypothetical protein